VKRREVITLLGGAAAWPLAARAQPAVKLPTVGFLGGNTSYSLPEWSADFVPRMRELGWVEGQTVSFDVRWADGRTERYAEIADEFVRLKVDVIVTMGPPTLAVKRATSTIPIVFATNADPVANGLVASLARPGGNVTGLSITSPDIGGKRFDLLCELVPGIRRLAIIANADYSPAMQELREVEAVAHSRGVETIALKIRSAGDVAPAFEELNNRADALYIVGETLTTANSGRISTFALAARLPTSYNNYDRLDPGGFMSYGAHFPSLYRRAAEMVDKILRGIKPADIPVEQPTRYDLVINLTTARALRLKIPESLLLRADKLIE
jgi:ABC-type uncharacterized transport system substrate-binding protein